MSAGRVRNEIGYHSFPSWESVLMPHTVKFDDIG
jgi:hypothetical protein